MEPNELGVVPAVDEKKVEEPEENIDDGQHSQEDKGTDDDTVVTPEEEDAKEDDPKDSRINNLMSNWQKAESSHNKTKSELDIYKQKFGDIDTEQPVVVKDNEDVPDSFKPDWNPKNIEDVQKGMRESAEYGAKQALGTIEKSRNDRQEAESAVDYFITEVKTADPEFDDKEFYKYANKHHFPLNNVQDLRSVYSSYYEMQKAIAGAGKTAIENKEKRNDKVNKPGSGEGQGSGINYEKIRGAHSATDLISDMLKQ